MRVWHRYLGLSLALLLVISASTGILLALKKDIAALQPPTVKGASKNLSKWKSIAELSNLAETALYTAEPSQQGNPISRLDIRPTKGMLKAIFKNGNWEVQLDGATGRVLSIDKRHSDWIESLHDGSIISDTFKLISMNFLGWGVLVLAASGFWLWYGPRRLRGLRWKRKG